MVRTRVGYAGGSTLAPSYQNIGDHTETLQLDYGPRQISYRELLEVSWSSHDASVPVYLQQYKSIVFTMTPDQQYLAEEIRRQLEEERGVEIFTEIRPLEKFYLAEHYHQKYNLRQVSALYQEYQAIYPDPYDLMNSTAVARVNGYLGGFGSLKRLGEELSLLGLSPKGEQKLLEIAEHRLMNP